MASRRSGGSGAFAVRAVLVVSVVLIVSLAIVALAARDGADPRSSAEPSVPSTSVPPSSGPGLSLTAPPPAPAVLASAAGAPAASLPRLRRELAPELSLPALGSRVALTVSQLGRPAVHLSYGPASVVPASTLKLLTTAAVLSALGPEHRFETTVVRGDTRRSIVLVGGGDPLLAQAAQTGTAVKTYPAPASLADLAAATAARLRAEGVHSVRLGYDVSLFSGPAVNPHWPSTYISGNVVSPISALWVDEGRENPGFAQRSADPALAAAEAFREELAGEGVTVERAPVEQRAPRGAVAMASVDSAPLRQIVEHVLQQSDNEGAEVLLRQVALADGRPGSFGAGVAAVGSTLARLGLDVRGVRMYDGSGLSRDDAVPPSLLLEILTESASATHPELRSVLTGLPVAGFSGTLGYRFDGDSESGRGYVRAKTGTLSGVHALAGIAQTRSGQALLFVAIADRVATSDGVQARADLDQIAAAISSCPC